jgi:hypothetical protein
MPPQSWRRAWKTGGWLRHLSGTTWPASTAARGVAAWIASLPASRASRGASPASGVAPTTSDGSGLTSFECVGTFDPDGSFWRTCPAFWEGASGLSSVTWPRSGAMRSGAVYERPMLARHIDENGSLCWATPDVPGGGRTITAEDVASRGQTPQGKRQVGLENEAKFWPTPCAQDDNKTPEAHLAMKHRMKGGPRQTITSLQVLTQLWTSRPVPATETPGPPSWPSGQTSRRRLNPRFVEWLMGWPERWTEP